MSQKVEITVLGDICPTDDYRQLFNSPNPSDLFGDILNSIKQSDISIANLEAPATHAVSPITKTGPNLKAEPKDIQLLKSAGINVLSLANNHILDFGVKGVLETLDVCKDLGIETVGGGKNIEQAKLARFINIKGKRIGILSFAEAEFNLATDNSPGANYFDPYESSDEIQIAKGKCDYLIVLYHGGIEHYIYPSPMLQKKCRKMVDWGADIVLCQHSHCIGTIENYKSSKIVYGQGNSIFGYREDQPEWNEGLIVRITMENEKEPDIEFQLVKATKNGMVVANKKESEKRIEQIYKLSAILNDKYKIQELWEQFSMSKAPLYLPMLLGRGRIFNKINRILKNLPIKFIYSKRKMMISMNLIRCQAHKELIQTVLENRK